MQLSHIYSVNNNLPSLLSDSQNSNKYLGKGSHYPPTNLKSSLHFSHYGCSFTLYKQFSSSGMAAHILGVT